MVALCMRNRGRHGHCLRAPVRCSSCKARSIGERRASVNGGYLLHSARWLVAFAWRLDECAAASGLAMATDLLAFAALAAYVLYVWFI